MSLLNTNIDGFEFSYTFSGDESPGLTQREGHEKSICTRLGLIINAFHEIIQSMIPMGTCTETMLKLLTRLYGTLNMLVKYVGFLLDYCEAPKCADTHLLCHKHSKIQPGAVARSVVCPLHKQRSRDRSLRPAHSYMEK